MKLRGRILVDDAWRAALDAIAETRGFPASHDVADLARCVSAVSHAYNHEGHDAAETVKKADALSARLSFFFLRDIAKGWGALRELAAAGLLDKPSLKVLDLGAGIGAMTWGLAHALAEHPHASRSIEAVLCDADAEALSLAKAVAENRTSVGDVKVTIRTDRQLAPFSPSLAGAPFDLVIAGQLLSELDLDLAPADRVKKHARLVRAWLDAVTPEGALVIVEPALRNRTRHLHALRDALAEMKAATIFAPCLHAASCPALAREDDWCAENRAIDLPSWLVPVARAASLRWEGSTFSYLVLRKDEISLARIASSHAARFRVVSDAIVTKGKSEFFLCGVMPATAGESAGRIR
ncbi:MAG: small ribosomal subunit Rsm22 family protein, partial [Polyangiaceae bacterium]